MPTVRPKIGDEKWEVEWVSELAFDENGNMDIDRNKHSFKYFPDKESALAFAKKIWPNTVKTIGVVEVMPIRFVPYDEDDTDPYIGFWESCGEIIHIEEDES
jgi:hypothetical protein